MVFGKDKMCSIRTLLLVTVTASLPSAHSLSAPHIRLQRHSIVGRSPQPLAVAPPMVAVESVEERTSTDGPLAWKWIDGSGHVASWATVLQDIRSTSVARKEVEVHIGCDSAVRPGGQEVIFAVAVCIISVG